MEEVNRFSNQWIWLEKPAWISDFEDTFKGFVDFEPSAYHRAWTMDFVCFEVQIIEFNLAVCFNLFFCLTLELD